MRVKLNITLRGNNLIREAIQGIIDRVEHPAPAVKVASEYMVNAARSRVTTTKTSPDGRVWDPPSPATLALRERILGSRGAGSLYATGRLASSIAEKRADDSGFTVEALAELAKWAKRGVNWPAKGMVRPKAQDRAKFVPARPFLGFSPENRRHITNVLRDYILTGKL